VTSADDPDDLHRFSFVLVVKVNGRDANAVLTMGQDTAMAKTDGSLQIQIPDEKSLGAKILWNRQYYVVPLEVLPDTIPITHPFISIPFRVHLRTS
jgi:hypothetical protein